MSGRQSGSSGSSSDSSSDSEASRDAVDKAYSRTLSDSSSASEDISRDAVDMDILGSISDSSSDGEASRDAVAKAVSRTLSDSSSASEDSSSDAVDMDILGSISDSSSDGEDRSKLSSPRSPHPPTQQLPKNTLESNNWRSHINDAKAMHDSRRDGRSQSMSIIRFLKSRTAEEDEQKHVSVDQATGLWNSPESQSGSNLGSASVGIEADMIRMTSGVTDERVLKLPLEFGWKRETRISIVEGRHHGEVGYFAPCGMILRRYPAITKYLERNGIKEITRDNFSFSPKSKVGAFYEAREGPKGPQWFLLTEEEITTIMIAMNGRRKRGLKSEHQPSRDGAGSQQWKHRRLNVGENNKPELQEMARLAAEIKLKKKVEKQALAQAAKEAKKEEALRAAEELRKKREQWKIEDQHRKIQRIQQMRLEKEARAKEILQIKKQNQQEAATARILAAEKRIKESERRKQEIRQRKEEENRQKAEIKKQNQQEAATARLLAAEKRIKDKEKEKLQAVMLKKEELERRWQEIMRKKEEETRKKAEEAELRRQHIMQMKAEETRKKAEDKERVKQQNMEEKRLSKERKLQLRRMALEKIKALKKPNKDMCLADLKQSTQFLLTSEQQSQGLDGGKRERAASLPSDGPCAKKAKLDKDV